MAESESKGGGGGEGRRKKRAWRKPREPATPTSDEGGGGMAAAKPIKLVRGVSSSSSTTPFTTPGSATSPPPHANGTGACVGSEKEGAKGGGTASEVVRERLDLTSLVSIDGSIMEGGGQILRISMTLSCLLGRPIHIHRIRAGRSKPGLRPQHMTGLHLLSHLCGGSLEGADVGSCEVTFHPGKMAGGDFVADTKTAGSICLLLQAALPVLLFTPKPSKVTLKGGTNADMAPPIDYFQKVFFVVAKKFGLNFDCHLKRRGFYPKGRGEVIYSSSPVRLLTPVLLTERGRLEEIEIHAYVAGAVPRKVGHAMIQSARSVINHYLSTIEENGVSVRETMVPETPDTAFGNGSGIIVVARTSSGCILAGSANGSRDVPPDATGKSAAEELVKDLSAGGCVDQHLQDQLIILMALAAGKSSMKTGSLTLHTRTAIHIAEMMTAGKAKFEVEEVEDRTCIIHCQGMGLDHEKYGR